MPGAAEPLYRSVTPAHQAALDLEASSRTLASVVDAASYGIERLQARRGILIDSIDSLHAIAPLRIDEFALAQPTAGSGPLGGAQ